MKIEKNFNTRTAPLVEVQPPLVREGPWCALGVQVEFVRLVGDPDRSRLFMHLTPDEALGLAADLVTAARNRIAEG